MSETYFSEENQQNLKKQAELLNADEIRSVGVHLEASGCEYLLCVDTVRYQNRWYILQSQGNLANLMGIGAQMAGMKEIPAEELEAIHALLD